MKGFIARLKRAFSLIELMVVIAIVSVLAAVAVPSYKTYMVKQQLSSLAPWIGTILQQCISYYNINGVFPDAYQLGFPNTDPVNYFYGTSNTTGWNQPLINGVYIPGQGGGGSYQYSQVFFLKGSAFTGNIISKTNNTNDVGSSDRVTCSIVVSANNVMTPSCATYLAIDNFAGPAGSYNLLHIP